MNRRGSDPSNARRAAVAALGTIVGVWAHPDDEAYLSAGLMAAAVDAGNRVVCVTATRGEHGTADPIRWPPVRLAALREKEMSASLAVLGVRDHIWLPYHDGACPYVDPTDAVPRIRRILDAVGADTVVTFGPDGMTGHPDHVAVGQWATAAVDGARRRPRLLYATKTDSWRDAHAALHAGLPVFGPEGPPAVRRDEVALALELTGRALDRKIAALRAHRSQTSVVVSMMGDATYRTWAADEYFVDAAGDAHLEFVTTTREGNQP